MLILAWHGTNASIEAARVDGLLETGLDEVPRRGDSAFRAGGQGREVDQFSVRQVELFRNGGGHLYCLLEALDAEAVRSHRAALGIPCGDCTEYQASSRQNTAFEHAGTTPGRPAPSSKSSEEGKSRREGLRTDFLRIPLSQVP